MIIKNRLKIFGENRQLIEYTHSFELKPPCCRAHEKINCQICFKRGKNKDVDKSSLIRSKTLISDYAACNDFTDFVTLTFNEKKVSGYDFDLCKSKVTEWLKYQRKKHSPDMIYLLVFEKHPTSGRIHAHMLLGNYNGELKPATSPKSGRRLYKGGHQVFNMPEFSWGFTTLTKIKNKEATSIYIKKYVTKDFINETNRKRFWHSRGLKLPQKKYNVALRNNSGTGELDLADPFTQKKIPVLKNCSTDKKNENPRLTHTVHSYRHLPQTPQNVILKSPILRKMAIQTELLKIEECYKNGKTRSTTSERLKSNY